MQDNKKKGSDLWTGLSKLSTEQLAELKTRIKAEFKSQLLRERIWISYPILEEISFPAVKFFDGKQAPNQWPNFLADIKVVNDPSHPDYAYFKALANAIEPNKPLDGLDVIMPVDRIQSEYEREGFVKDLLPNCLKEIKKVYLMDIKTDDDGEITYTPVVRKQVV